MSVWKVEDKDEFVVINFLAKIRGGDKSDYKMAERKAGVIYNDWSESATGKKPLMRFLFNLPLYSIPKLFVGVYRNREELKSALVDIKEKAEKEAEALANLIEKI